MRKAHSSNPEQLSYKTVQGFILYNTVRCFQEMKSSMISVSWKYLAVSLILVRYISL